MRKPDRATSTKDKRNALRFKYVWREKVKVHRAKVAACWHVKRVASESPDVEVNGQAIEGDLEIHCTSCGLITGVQRCAKSGFPRMAREAHGAGSSC